MDLSDSDSEVGEYILGVLQAEGINFKIPWYKNVDWSGHEGEFIIDLDPAHVEFVDMSGVTDLQLHINVDEDELDNNDHGMYVFELAIYIERGSKTLHTLQIWNGNEWEGAFSYDGTGAPMKVPYTPRQFLVEYEQEYEKYLHKIGGTEMLDFLDI